MEKNSQNIVIIILLILISILIPFISLAFASTIGFLPSVFVAVVLPTFLMYNIISKIQTQKKRKVYIFSMYIYSAALAIFAFIMLFYMFQLIQGDPSPNAGVTEARIGFTSFFVAIITTLSLSVAIAVSRSSKSATQEDKD